MKKIIVGYIMVGCVFISIYAQPIVSGTVEDASGLPLSGVNLYWAENLKGTISDTLGQFTLAHPDSTRPARLVVSHIGYKADTFEVSAEKQIRITLSETRLLNTIVIEERMEGTRFKTSTVNLIENLSKNEFKKAACCNLSESFETNASIDVSFSDAVTGAKHIQLLGLDGKYVQLTTELLPSIRGLSSPFGLTYIAGPWLESIQISKGAGSVVNGFEALTGQINVELRKPENEKRLHVNAYVNHMGHTEGNVIFTHRFKGKRWSTALLTHGDYMNIPVDDNDDTFQDIPLIKQGSFVHRWAYHGEKFETQFGVKGLYETRGGGNMAYVRNDSLLPKYGFDIQTWRGEAFCKLGIFFDGQDWKSIGIQTNGTYHNQHGFFGNNSYIGIQRSAFLNIIYQSIFSNTKHKFKTGFSFQYDQVDETFDTIGFKRLEFIPAGYFEYTFDNLNNFALIAGARLDYHNLLGLFPIPRLNIKWEITKGLNFRISGGRGWRVPNLFAENTTALVSSRQINLIGYELKPEVAWNYGASLHYTFQMRKRDASIVADFFRTDFTNQLIMDREEQGSLKFHNLNGSSFSNVFQFTISFEPVKQFEIRMAYRWQDVRAVFSGTLERVPLVPEHKAFINLSYITAKWGLSFDFTAKLNGPSRIPAVSDPSGNIWQTLSPWYPIFHAQIAKDFKIIEWYVGCENIGGYTQPHPIVDAQNPFGNNFDASLIWAPIFGRMFYTGIRFDLDYKAASKTQKKKK